MFIKTIMFGRDKRSCMIKLHGKTPKLFEIRPLVMENEALKVPLCGGGITLKSSILAYPHPPHRGTLRASFSTTNGRISKKIGVFPCSFIIQKRLSQPNIIVGRKDGGVRFVLGKLGISEL